MSLELVIVVLISWTAVGFLAALFFGRMFQDPLETPNEQHPIPASSSASPVKYFRRNKRKTQRETPEPAATRARGRIAG